MKHLARRLLHGFWYVHPLVVLTVQAAPVDCMRALATAARPSQHRLHLRNLFTEGRRYFVQPLENGFRLTSSSKVPWRRSRTTIAAVLLGEFAALDESSTRISLRARMRLFYFLDLFLIPAFMTSLLIFAPWHPLLIVGLAALLFALSWLWHRLTATLQASEMVYFVQKALEDLTPATIPGLGEGAPDVIAQDQEFREQWQKFYDQHRDGEMSP